MKRRESFTLLPVLVSIVVGLASMQPLNVVAVNHRGLGIESVEPHRLSTSASVADVALRARARVRKALAGVWSGIWGHPLRGPAFAVLALGVVLNGDADAGVLAASVAILPADIDTGRALFRGAGGRWATEQMLRALNAGRQFSVASLRTADTLRKDEWKAYDEAIIAEAQIRLRGVAALIAAGLVHRIPNGLGKMMLEWEKVTDMDDAEVSMDGIAGGESGRQDFELDGLPLPLIHKSFYLHLRHLLASRERGEPLDMSQARASSRKVSETAEHLLFNGTTKKFGGRSIYGLTTHPNRNTTAFGNSAKNWVQTDKTGENIVADVQTLIKLANADRFHGPFWLFVSGNAGYRLEEDFKANSDKTIRQRILDIDGIQRVEVVDKLADNNVLLVQATPDVIDVVEGLPLTSMQWDVEGGMRINFKAATILIPRVRADAAGRSGVQHMS